MFIQFSGLVVDQLGVDHGACGAIAAHPPQRIKNQGCGEALTTHVGGDCEPLEVADLAESTTDRVTRNGLGAWRIGEANNSVAARRRGVQGVFDVVDRETPERPERGMVDLKRLRQVASQTPPAGCNGACVEMVEVVAHQAQFFTDRKPGERKGHSVGVMQRAREDTAHPLLGEGVERVVDHRGGARPRQGG